MVTDDDVTGIGFKEMGTFDFQFYTHQEKPDMAPGVVEWEKLKETSFSIDPKGDKGDEIGSENKNSEDKNAPGGVDDAKEGFYDNHRRSWKQ